MIHIEKTFVLLSITILLFGWLPGSYPVLAVQYNEVTFDMRTETEMVLETVNNHTGTDASATRMKIDSEHGNSNGIVEATESESFKNSVQGEVQGLGVTQNTYLDRLALQIRFTTVRVENAEGPVNGTFPLQVIYTSELRTLEEPDETGWHTLVFLGEYYGNNTIRVIVPEGWRIAKNPKNLQVTWRSGDSREIAGIASGNYDVEIKMYDPSQFESDDDNGSFILTNIIYIIPLVMLVMVVMILVIFGRKKRGNKISGDASKGKKDQSTIDKRTGENEEVPF